MQRGNSKNSHLKRLVEKVFGLAFFNIKKKNWFFINRLTNAMMGLETPVLTACRRRQMFWANSRKASKWLENFQLCTYLHTCSHISTNIHTLIYFCLHSACLYVCVGLCSYSRQLTAAKCRLVYFMAQCRSAVLYYFRCSCCCCM